MATTTVTLDQQLRNRAEKELDQEIKRLIEPIEHVLIYHLRDPINVDGTITLGIALKAVENKIKELKLADRQQAAVNAFLTDVEKFKRQLESLDCDDDL